MELHHFIITVSAAMFVIFVALNFQARRDYETTYEREARIRKANHQRALKKSKKITRKVRRTERKLNRMKNNGN